MYYFDNNGWITEEVIQGRGTSVSPVGELSSTDNSWMFTGFKWIEMRKTPEPEPVLSPEQLRQLAKKERELAVQNIKVTTQAGNTFDGDETSQTRMSRAILVLSTGFASSVPWVLADNSVIQADAAELTEALALAGQAQAAIWVI